MDWLWWYWLALFGTWCFLVLAYLILSAMI